MLLKICYRLGGVLLIAGLLLPLGLLLWWRIWRFRLRLLRDLKQIIASNEKIVARIGHENL